MPTRILNFPNPPRLEETDRNLRLINDWQVQFFQAVKIRLTRIEARLDAVEAIGADLAVLADGAADADQIEKINEIIAKVNGIVTAATAEE